MIEINSIGNFLAMLSSSAAVPGGGAASALTAACGAALGEMVANLTSGKKRYADAQARIDELIPELEALQERFLALADADAEAFAPLSRAYGMPTGTEEEAARKAEVMEVALQAACEPPLEIMEQLGKAVELLEELARIGTRLALSDVGAGAALCEAALKSASLNVYANAALMKDRAVADSLIARCDEMRENTGAAALRIFNEVMEGCRR